MFGMTRVSSFIFVATVCSAVAAQEPAVDKQSDGVPSPADLSSAPGVQAAEQQTLAPMPQYAVWVPCTCTSPFDGDIADRPFLLGSAGGASDQLTANGIGVNVYSTQFYQGVASGGVNQEFDFNGRMDYLVDVDGQKAGLWQGFFISLHGETRYGDGIGSNSGTIMPINTARLFPSTEDTVTALTAVKFTQALSENFITFAGKINMLDELKQPYAAGRGVDAFMNLALTLPVPAARTVPYSTLGAGFAVLRDMQPAFTMMVLDTNDTPTTSGFESFFNNGATILTRIETPVTFLDRVMHFR